MNILRHVSSSTWAQLGTGIDSAAYALTEHNGHLIAGGAFVVAGGEQVNHIARWDESAWHPLGSGLNGEVRALLSLNGELIVGGTFTAAGGQPSLRWARWGCPPCSPDCDASASDRVV